MERQRIFLRSDILQDGTEQAHNTLGGLDKQRATAPVTQYDAGALPLVGLEHGFHALIKLAAIDQHITFKIMLETAEIKVRTARGSKIVVHNHRLGMHHRWLIEVNLDTCQQAFFKMYSSSA